MSDKELIKDVEDLLDGRRSFQIEFENGETKSYYIGMPTAEDVRQADWEHAKVYNRAIRDGVLTAAEMKDILEKRGLIGPEHEKAGEELRVKLAERLITMERENDKDERVKLAVEVANLREEIFQWNQRVTGPMATTCEQIADDARTAYLASAVVQDQAGKRIWETNEEFKTEPDLAVQTKARFEVMLWMQGLESDFLDKTPENQILRELLEEAAAESVERLPKELTEGDSEDKVEDTEVAEETQVTKPKRKRRTVAKKQ